MAHAEKVRGEAAVTSWKFQSECRRDTGVRRAPTSPPIAAPGCLDGSPAFTLSNWWRMVLQYVGAAYRESLRGAP